MKILSIVWSIGMGGTERGAVNYAIGYHLKGHDSKMLVLGEGYDRYPDLEEAGVDSILLKKCGRKESEVFAELKHWAPDIIHTHNYNDALLPYLHQVKTHETKIVETNVFSRPNFSKTYPVISLSMQLSQWGYWKYSRWMRTASYCPAISIAPYIVDVARFGKPAEEALRAFRKRYRVPENAYVVGRLGQPHPSKWDSRIVEIIRQTIKEGNTIHYLLVGVPPEIVSEIEQLPATTRERVRLIDKIEGDSNLSLYYYNLQCFLHLSKIGESFGYVLAEALYCRVPVVTMLTPLKDNAQFEVVGHQTGGLCATGIDECVVAVNTLYHDKNLHATISRQLDGWIEKRFSFDAVIPGMIQQYEKLLAGKNIERIEAGSVVRASGKLYGWKRLPMLLAAKIVNASSLYRLADFFKNR